jgi:TRAP-type C4-dicarboxylate transport system substrate-binding protein
LLTLREITDPKHGQLAYSEQQPMHQLRAHHRHSFCCASRLDPTFSGVFMKRRALHLSLLAGLLALSGFVSAQTKWDLPAAYPATNFHSLNLAQFATDVDKASGGKLKITVHANASLFKAPEIKRAVQGGQAQAGEILLVNFQNEWQIFGTDGLPFLADSYDESNKLYKAQKPALEKKLGEQGINLLYAVAWPPQGIYSKKPLASAADLKGIKWRAYSPATSRIAELVGAQPVTVQAAEVSQAFATGVTDSMMSSGSTGWDAKLHEHVKYWYDTQAWLPKNVVLVNVAAFKALDKATQDALLKAAADAETRGLASAKKANGETLDKLKGGGMNILPPPPALKADMAKVGETLLKEWLTKAGRGPGADRRLPQVRQAQPDAPPARRPVRPGRRPGGAVHGGLAGDGAPVHHQPPAPLLRARH